jgi:3-methyladenine DNA glycosylase AlkD
LPLQEVVALLHSPMHEDRLTALLIWVDQFTRTSDPGLRRRICASYLRHRRLINNWDLVDTSAAPILGAWLEDRSRGLLDRMARSRHLWSRRMAIIATYHYIRRGDAEDALRLSLTLIEDPHELIHKACGWMLREVGKRVSQDALRGFLRPHAGRMPRVMLRYAIERLPVAERQRWLRAR